MTTSSTVTDKEIEQIERLAQIIREGSRTTRDFYNAYREAKKKEDELRRQQQKANNTSSSS